jgi:hypothetical protein
VRFALVEYLSDRRAARRGESEIRFEVVWCWWPEFQRERFVGIGVLVSYT